LGYYRYKYLKSEAKPNVRCVGISSMRIQLRANVYMGCNGQGDYSSLKNCTIARGMVGYCSKY
jgi:hypothetical protein